MLYVDLQDTRAKKVLNIFREKEATWENDDDDDRVWLNDKKWKSVRCNVLSNLEHLNK